MEENRSAVGMSEKETFDLLPSENGSLIHKLTFLTLVKTSNKIYRPKKGANINGVNLFCHQNLNYSNGSTTRIHMDLSLTMSKAKYGILCISSDRQNHLKNILETLHRMHQKHRQRRGVQSCIR